MTGITPDRGAILFRVCPFCHLYKQNETMYYKCVDIISAVVALGNGGSKVGVVELKPLFWPRSYGTRS